MGCGLAIHHMHTHCLWVDSEPVVGGSWGTYNTEH